MTATEYMVAERRGGGFIGSVNNALQENPRVRKDPYARDELGEEALCHGLRST